MEPLLIISYSPDSQPISCVVQITRTLHFSVPEYEVISPFQADEFGNLVGYSLPTQTRTRRNTNEASFWYFKVEAFGTSIHMNLTKVRPFISSAALVQTVHINGSSTYKEIPRGVYYAGHVTSDPGSLVAINEKKGLVRKQYSFISLTDSVCCQLFSTILIPDRK